MWQPDNKQAKIIINTESSGLTEEIVPSANHFVLEINHFNRVISGGLTPKLSTEDAYWNSKTLEGIEQSIQKADWINL